MHASFQKISPLLFNIHSVTTGPPASCCFRCFMFSFFVSHPSLTRRPPFTYKYIFHCFGGTFRKLYFCNYVATVMPDSSLTLRLITQWLPPICVQPPASKTINFKLQTTNLCQSSLNCHPPSVASRLTSPVSRY